MKPLLALAVFMATATASPESREFFETRIRPILAQDCYECHQTNGKQKAGLILDHRAGLLAGGESGPVIVPGDPNNSLLMKVIRHEIDDFKMPKAGAKLEDHILADFEKWIANGAFDPRDEPPSAEEIAEETDWEAVRRRRQNWWSFQPIKAIEPPVADKHPVDAFIDAKLSESDLTPAVQADRRTLIRRLSYALRGLPPTPAEIAAFLEDHSSDAYERLVDTFLTSTHFGERWARHWMDWIRYAESHGSEGDPAIPHAWKYRDYLIRALNAEVPYDQLVREHIAGDLLDKPRMMEDSPINESTIGTAHLRMVFHGFAPTDALDELVRFTDDQINSLTKGFLGLTVSCARCHDHKFDAISQKDYYALYGIMVSSRPAMLRADVPIAEEVNARKELKELEVSLREALIKDWRNSDTFPSGIDLNAVKEAKEPSLLLPLKHLIDEDFDAKWNSWLAEAGDVEKGKIGWHLGREADLESWHRQGPGLREPSPSGTVSLHHEGPKAIRGIYPSGAYSHLHSTKDRGVMQSPRILLDQEYDLWVRLAGEGDGMVRYAVQHYPRNGTVYPVRSINSSEWSWVRFGLDYWTGDHIHVEITTAADQPLLAKTDRERSWFGVREAMLLPKGSPRPAEGRWAFLKPLVSMLEHKPPRGAESLVRAYDAATRIALDDWFQGKLSDEQALLLNEALKAGMLENDLDKLTHAAPLVERYRQLEAKIEVPQRVPGVIDTDPLDHPLFNRGNHRQPLEPVSRRFLEAIDETPYQTSQSGRLELAADMLRPDNPFTSRVIVNRLWHHLFGQGIVGTPDNFGRLGEKPSHPELLDYLAHRFVNQDGWSIKQMIRLLVTSETWKRVSEPSEAAQAADPANRLLSHANVRRLEGEAIRDALLEVSGRLERNRMEGPPVGGESDRRSVYVRVIRNRLDPFLSTFDAPVPSSSKGRRDVTNVPAQSLTMLNNPFVLDLARAWGERVEQLEGGTDARLREMFEKAFGRPPDPEEARKAAAFLQDLEDQREAFEKDRGQLQVSLTKAQRELERLLSDARERVLADRGDSPVEHAGPKPLAHWDFSQGLQDQLGNLHGQLHGGAKLANGVLVLDGRDDFVSTKPLAKDLGEKTLEAWVQLGTLDQSGGGVITVQDLRGVVFDSIVYAERQPRKWMAGSDTFNRTKDFTKAPKEEAALNEPVHLAIVYQADGTIIGYRNGEPYGRGYKSSGLARYKAGDAQILFGNRHGNNGDAGRCLEGKIFQARLYDRALSSEEVAASASGDANFVSASDLLAIMSEKERRRRAELESQIESTRTELEALEKNQGAGNPWAELAHALFNVKEFIYLR